MDEHASPLYGIGRVAEMLECSVSTVRRLADDAGVVPVRSAGGRKFTRDQIKKLKKLKAGKRRYENLPPKTRTVGMVARKLGVMPITIRAAIRRLEAQDSNRVIARRFPVTEYGREVEISLVADDAIPLIERALRSPRRRTIEHPYACRGVGRRRQSEKRAFLQRELRALHELRHKQFGQRLLELTQSAGYQSDMVVKALRWLIQANVLRYVARRICLTGYYDETNEFVNKVNESVLQYLLKRPPLPTEAEGMKFDYERLTRRPSSESGKSE